MKTTLPVIVAVLLPLAASAQQTFLQCDFSEGIPADFTLYDLDGSEPSIDMKNTGFATGIPWIAAESDKDGNVAACSTSWYRTPGKSDDWMVTPAITVGSKRAVLRWRAKAGDKDYRDGYSVYISDRGNAPEDFDKSSPVFTTEAEKAVWTEHEVSLEPYAGKTVYVAFVNDSKDKATLWIDDIVAGVPACLEVESGIPRVVGHTGPMTVSGKVNNTSGADINGFTVKYRFGDGGETYAERIEKQVKAGGSASFSILSPVEIRKNETLEYTLWVEADGDGSSVEGKVSSYKRRIVAEEVTGTWCGYCVRGIVAMERMKADYGDTFLGIAVHDGTTGWEDPMSMPEYTDWLFSKFNMSGYPHCTVNRMVTYTGDPGNLHTYYSLLKDKENHTGLELAAELDDDTKGIKATTTLYTSRDMEESNLRLAYVLLENNVHCADKAYDENGKPTRHNGWQQNNYYAGGGKGEMGGYEDMPEIVPGEDMWYQCVARYISDGFDGIEDSLPSEIKEGVGVVHKEHIELPGNIRNYAETELAVLLINGKSQEIVNAEAISLKELFPSGVGTGVAEDGSIAISMTGGIVKAECGGLMASLSVYAADGGKVRSVSGASQSLEADIEGIRGVCMVEAVSVDGSRLVRKIML